MKTAAIFLPAWAIALLVVQAHAAVIAGRVVDSAGRPVAAAEVRLWRKTNGGNRRGENQPIEVDGATAWRTDEEGRFQTPAIADSGAAIRVVAQAEAMLAGRSGWIASGEKTTIDAGNLVLRRLRTVSGRLVDRRGAGIADATVFNSGDGHRRVETKSDAAGKFRLPGVPEGQFCLFAEHLAYRFQGAVFRAEVEHVELELSRFDDPIEPLRALPPLLPAAEAVELGRRVVDPYLDTVVDADDSAKMMAIYALSCVDWLAAVERLDALPFDDAEEHQRVRQEILLDAMRNRRFDDWPELKALIESAACPEAKAACYTYASRRLFADGPAAKRQLLNEALLQARAIVEAK
ncbi:MAG TPA: carboxypeptidase regulatory-like domain-containing protein, partial [Thermomicrobiales bacterium]|nr:carboxypeptidase regulatory-like domain-containing protein [Thermomicrobiales bacterium]